ncbi:MAG: TlpA family protein disulfide reductase [Planctomycetes bacterium]|nr:TlpA family protein disulfide reductase [Planctomycetota bacterium]
MLSGLPTAGRRLAALFALLVAGCGRPPTHPAVGVRLGPLPIAPITDLKASPPAFTGRVTLVNCWATWCPPCRRELPSLVRTAAGLATDERFQLVAVSCSGSGAATPADLAAETAAFLIEQKLTLRSYVFTDPLAADLVRERLRLDALPTTYLVGPDAAIRRVWTGYHPRDEADIAAAIVTLLREAPRPE